MKKAKKKTPIIEAPRGPSALNYHLAIEAQKKMNAEICHLYSTIDELRSELAIEISESIEASLRFNIWRPIKHRAALVGLWFRRLIGLSK